jgi:hypothetical protein
VSAEPPPPPSAPARAGEQSLLPLLALVAIVIAMLTGGYVVAGALSEAAGPPVSVAGVVRVSPLSGWEVARRFASPPGARLTRGAGTLDVFVMLPPDASPADLVRAYTDRFLEPDSSQLSASTIRGVTLDRGLAGARMSYVGTFGDRRAPIEGQLTAVVAPSGAGIVYDGWAPRGLLRYALDDIDRMVGRAEVT